MKYKSKNLKYNGEEIEFQNDGTLFVKVPDPSSDSGYRTLKKTFKNWNEVMGADKLTLAALYEDVFPEFIGYNPENGKIQFNEKEFFKYCPDTRLTFTLTDEDIFTEQMQVKKELNLNVDAHGFEYEKVIAPDAPVIQPEEKGKKKSELDEMEERLYERIYKKVYEDIAKEFKIPKISYKIKENLELKKIIQLDKKGEVIGYFTSAADAGKTLNIAASSISANLKGKRKSAGGFIFVHNK